MVRMWEVFRPRPALFWRVSREEARPGDLVFFTGTYASAGAVSHVGIYVGGSRMLHCGSVRPDRTEVEVDERRAA